jgi:hypothetical protein
MGRLWETACLEIKLSEPQIPQAIEATEGNNGAVSHRL